MPPSPIDRLNRPLLWFVCCVFAGLYSLAATARAAALGELVVQSRLGEPLQAEIRLLAVSAQESADLLARLASAEAFERANVPFDPVLHTLKFGVMQRDGAYFVTVSSTQPMEQLTVSLLLELRADTSRLMREYTLLIDPPGQGGQPHLPPQTRPVLAAQDADDALFRVTGSALPHSPFVPQVAAENALPRHIAYTIRSDDVLGRIASRFKADDMTIYQMMVAIFKTNRSAFVGNNINRMRVGRTLMIPDEVTVRNVNQSEARSLVIQQGKAYRSGIPDAPEDDRW